MGQAEVYDFLKRNGPVDARQISEGLGVGIRTVNKTLSALKEWGEIEFRDEFGTRRRTFSIKGGKV